MAEYKALAQNTYKFVSTSEVVFHTVGNLSDPRSPGSSRIKFIENDNEIMYGMLSPVAKSVSAPSAFARSEYGYSGSGSSAESSVMKDYNEVYPMFKKACVDGQWFYGTTNAYYAISYMDVVSKNTTTSAITGKTFPACKVRVLRYVASTGLVVVDEYDCAKTATASIKGVSNTSNSSYAYQYMCIGIPKASADIIISIEFEYPKYDITFNDAVNGVQYSVDDGATFQDVTAGLVLEQVEHIVLKNTSETTRLVGTTVNGSDVASVAAGATYVAVPTASGTWHIS